MSFTDRLLLWFHIGFAVFTLGPVSVAMMATPRYIRLRDLPVLRYLYRTTRIFGVLTLGVFVFGLALGRDKFNQAWLSASMTLFIVAAVLLVLVFRDQHRAIVAIEKTLVAEEGAARAVSDEKLAQPVPANAAADTRAKEEARADTGKKPQGASEPASPSATTSPAHIATVEKGRIASMGGVISAIWLVILVLMVWNG
ncbi:MAG: hypothetical protein ACM3ML_04135 [Micromonosporaceae bacterium]